MSQKIVITALENAFQSLAQTIEQLSNTQWFAEQPEIIQDTLIAGTIQKFEFVYELSLKMMKRQLAAEAINDEINSADFRDVLRAALQTGLIENIDDWIAYRKMRNITSHTYDQNKAQEVYGGMQNFLKSSEFLLNQLRIRNIG